MENLSQTAQLFLIRTTPGESIEKTQLPPLTQTVHPQNRLARGVTLTEKKIKDQSREAGVEYAQNNSTNANHAIGTIFDGINQMIMLEQKNALKAKNTTGRDKKAAKEMVRYFQPIILAAKNWILKPLAEGFRTQKPDISKIINQSNQNRLRLLSQIPSEASIFKTNVSNRLADVYDDILNNTTDEQNHIVDPSLN